MSEQFAKITLDQAIREYQLGFMTATGLVRYWVKISMAYGWKQRKNPKEICDLLTISKSAFYKAIATLKTLGYIDFECHGEMSITNTEPEDKGGNSTNVDKFHDRGKKITNVENEPQTWTGDDNRGQDFTTVENEPPQSSLSNGSSPSSDSSQIIIKSSSSSSQRGEDSKTDDDDEMMDFDLWMKRIKVPELIADGVKKPQAYLKSLDKTTGQPLIEKYRAEWEQLKSATLQTRALVNIKPKFPIGTMVYHWNSGYSGQIVSYPHQKRALVNIGEDTLLFPVEELHTEPDDRPVPTYASLREALASQFPELSARVKS